MARTGKYKTPFCLAALAFAGAAFAQPTSPRFGVQLWSVKDEVKQDFEGTLRKIAALGFDGVEFAGDAGPYAKDAPGLRALLDKTGLQCAGAHLDFESLGAARFDATTAFYKTAGCSTLVIAFDTRAAGTAGAAGVAKDLSALSAKLAPLGLRIGYHNHGEEMTGPGGQTPWDVIARGTPRAVVLQQDIGWTTFAGKDPVSLIARYPGRTVSAHFKAKFLKGSGGTALIGRDRTDWRAIASAAASVGGAEWIILEQEEYPSGMGQLEALAASWTGLRAALKK